MLEEWRRLTKSGIVLFVSSQGNVISDSFMVIPSKGAPYIRPSMYRKQYVGNHGYWAFRFKNVLYLTHRLVAEAFVEGDHSLEVNHIDGNKLNCHYTNLEWVSSSQNIKHAWDNGLRCVSENTPKGEDQFLAKLTNDAVYEILTNLDKPCRYFAEKYNTSLVTVNDVQTGKKWKHLFPDIIRKTPEGGKRKLSDADVITIRKSSISAYELTKIYGLSRSSIRDIQLFNTYKDVEVV
jgi:hypothetical protein